MILKKTICFIQKLAWRCKILSAHDTTMHYP